jgi:hypothetical protein
VTCSPTTSERLRPPPLHANLARTELVWLEAAYIATPADVNETGRWRLDPLVDVVIFRNKQDFPQGVSHTVDSGQVYLLGEPGSVHSVRSEKVFDAGIHLGKVKRT